MENVQRPTMRSRKLGQTLREIREARGLTLQQAARQLNRTPSSLSKLETGKRGIRRPALENMLDRYEVTDSRVRQFLFELAQGANEKGWWQRYAGKLLPTTLDYISLETEAVRINSWQMHLVPGLLQSETYIRAVVASGTSHKEPSDIEALTSVRLRRQAVLLTANPPIFNVVISEGVLRQQIGGREVMRVQCDQLIKASTLDCVTLQVLPFSADAHPGLNGSFNTLHTRDMSVVLVENLTTGWYLEEKDEVTRYDLAFEQLRTAALSPIDSLSLIEKLRSET